MTDSNEGEPAVVIERRSGGGIGVFLLGVAVGAGIALLYAPASGSETRADLRRSARRAQRKVRDLAEGAQDAAQGIARDVVRSTRDAVRSTRDAARDAREVLERRLTRHERAGPGAVRDDDEDSGA